MLTYIAVILAIGGLYQVIVVIRGVFRGLLKQPGPVAGWLMKAVLLASGLGHLYVALMIFRAMG